MQKYRHIFLGLAVVVAAAGFLSVQNEYYNLGLYRIPLRLSYNRIHLRTIAQRLRNYKEKTGQYPTNDQGLVAVADTIPDQLHRTPADYDSNINHLRASKNGILSAWGEPFIYENRRGLPASAFADSGATKDTDRIYSIKVDKGIYVWSLAAEQKHRTYLAWTRKLNLIRTAVIAVALVILSIYIRLTWKAKGERPWRAAGTVTVEVLISALVSAFIVFPAFVRTCYASAITRPRTPELTKDYIALITKYHDRGVIGDKAYHKIIESLEKEAN